MDVVHCSGTVVSIPFNGHKFDTLLYHTDAPAEAAERKLVILRLHGLLGSLLDETEHFLPTILAKKGYSSMTVNTLLANLGLFFGFGLFDETVAQIDAACAFLRHAGYEKIVVAGHGLGGCMALRYGAMVSDSTELSALLGIIAIATPYSMPDTIRRRWDRYASEPRYEEVYRKASRLFGKSADANKAHDEIVVVRRAHGPTARPEHSDIYTLRTWWALAGPEADGAKPYKQVGKITVPLLLVHGSADELISSRELEDLSRLASAHGNPDVTHVQLDANHTFDGKHAELGDCIVSWLADRFE